MSGGIRLCQFTSFMIQNMIASVSLFLYLRREKQMYDCIFLFLFYDTCMEKLFPMRNIESYHILHCLYTHFAEIKSNETRNKFIIYSISVWRWLIIQFKIPNFVFWLNSTACTQNCAALRRLRLLLLLRLL